MMESAEKLLLSFTGNLEVLPSAKSKKLAIKPNGILFILPFGFIPRSARRTSTSSAKKPPWNWVFRGQPPQKSLNFPFGAGDGNRTRVNSLEGCGNEPLYDTREISKIVLALTNVKDGELKCKC